MTEEGQNEKYALKVIQCDRLVLLGNCSNWYELVHGYGIYPSSFDICCMLAGKGSSHAQKNIFPSTEHSMLIKEFIYVNSKVWASGVFHYKL